MFVWDYSTLMAAGISLWVGLVLALWVYYTLIRQPFRRSYNNGAILKQCPFCLFLFQSWSKVKLSRCPCCQSLLEDEVENENSKTDKIKSE